MRAFTLGQFFGVWGVRLTPRCLGGYCSSTGKRVWVFVDGRRISDDPRLVVLAEHEEIVVAYGTRESSRVQSRPVTTSQQVSNGGRR